jgi:protein-L-isoaspartate(D-aspartate) O-methyltransferase
MDTVEKYQQQLLEQSQSLYYRTPISDATARAYLATPRHVFVKRYREWGTKEWHEVHAKNLAEHVATLYTNKPLVPFGDDDDNIPSTISQPSFVLRMLDLLQLRPGQRVFELGAGSGWNAALMGYLVGPEGHVYSLDIVPEVAAMAAGTIETRGIKNVQIVAADGGEGYAAGAPYDRAIFTAGTYDLPRHFYEQIKDGGLLLVVIKNEGGGDNLFLLRKTGDHFESLESMPCAFVQLRGKYQLDSLGPITLETLREWTALQHQEIARMPFWWGGKGNEGVLWRTLGIRSFLGITEPSFRAFKTEKADPRSPEEHYFGLWEKENRSLVLAKDDWLIAYGDASAKERLLQRIRQWVELGMPSAASFALQVYPQDVPVAAGKHQWIVKRIESQFLWSLSGTPVRERITERGTSNCRWSAE